MEKYNKFWFLELWKFLLPLEVPPRDFHFSKYNKTFLWENISIFLGGVLFFGIQEIFLGQIFFYFFELGLKSVGFDFQKYKKSFLLRKCKNFLILELESSISWNIEIFFLDGFFLFFKIRPKKWRVPFPFWGFRFLKYEMRFL